MITVGAILTLLLFGCAMHGWGTLARRAAGLPAGTWPMTMAIGLAAWIAIGGVLNLLHLAYPVVIWLLLASGCGILARTIFDRRLHIRSVLATGREEKLYWIAWLCLATVIIGFTIATQLSPSAYNHHDDYQKYFVHVARLLQTGTLRGSPLNTLGSETLGGQAFLQAAFVAYLQFSFINAADAVLCFSLMILLIGGIALRRPALAPVALSTMIAVWLFEPQYVNITSLYSAAALIFAVITLTVDRREYAAGNASCPPAAVVGLLYAALMALKPTFGPLIFLHISFCAVVEVVSSRRIGSAVKRSLAVASWGLLFLAPWLALYAPLYWIALTAPVVGTVEAPIPMIQTINLLATSTLFYGGSYAAYTLVALVPPICGAVAVAQRGWTDPMPHAWAPPAWPCRLPIFSCCSPQARCSRATTRRSGTSCR